MFFPWPTVTVTPKSKSEGGNAGVSDEHQGDQTETLQGISDIRHDKEDCYLMLQPECCLFRHYLLHIPIIYTNITGLKIMF